LCQQLFDETGARHGDTFRRRRVRSEILIRGVSPCQQRLDKPVRSVREFVLTLIGEFEDGHLVHGGPEAFVQTGPGRIDPTQP
jgi:hypothetical protein